MIRLPLTSTLFPYTTLFRSVPLFTTRRFSLRDSKVLACGTWGVDRKSTRLNSSHVAISYAVFCLKKKKLKLKKHCRTFGQLWGIVHRCARNLVKDHRPPLLL